VAGTEVDTLPPVAVLSPSECLQLASQMGGTLTLDLERRTFTLLLPTLVSWGRRSDSAEHRSDDVPATPGGETELGDVPTDGRRPVAPGAVALMIRSQPSEGGSSTGGGGGGGGVDVSGGNAGVDGTMPAGDSQGSTSDASRLSLISPPPPPVRHLGDATAPSPRERAPRARLLIVEDESMTAKMAARHAARLGWAADVVSDGADVPLTATGNLAGDWACVFLDIVMPRSNGLHVCQRLRAAGCTTHIVAMTANSSGDDILAYQRAGFDGILPKPFTTAEMAAALNAATNGVGWRSSGGSVAATSVPVRPASVAGVPVAATRRASATRAPSTLGGRRTASSGGLGAAGAGAGEVAVAGAGGVLVTTTPAAIATLAERLTDSSLDGHGSAFMSPTNARAGGGGVGGGRAGTGST
jgi:CheY-like chemotaxis protein